MISRYKIFVRNYLLNTSLFDFVFAYAFYNLFFSIQGLSTLEISLLLTWWAFTALVLEIPSGALADRWSRKNLMILAPLVKSMCFIIWYFADGNIFLYGLGFLFWSIGSSFMSGTAEAILYDELKGMKLEYKLERILSLKNFFFNLSLAISILLGGIIAQYDIKIALLLSVIPLFLSAIFAAQIPETKILRSTGETSYFKNIKNIFIELKENKIFLYLTIYLLGVSIMGQLEEFDQLFYRFVNLPLYAFGVVGFIWSVIAGLGGYFAYKIKSKRVFVVFPFLVGLLLIVVGSSPSISIIALLLIAYLLVSPLKVKADANIQKVIVSQSRATVTSTSSFLVCLFAIVTTPFCGYIGDSLGVNYIYILAGLMFLILSFLTFIKRRSLKGLMS